MGITVWWQLETDSQDKIEAMARKWEEKYKGELDLAHINHTFKRIKRLCRLTFQKMRFPLEMQRIKTYEDLERQVSEGRIRILTKMPSMQEFLQLIQPAATCKFLVFDIPFDRELREFLQSRLNMAKWTATWIYPGVYFSPPQPYDVEGVNYVNVPCTGFIVNTAATETIALVFAEISPNKYFCTDICKTQPGRNEQVRDCTFVHMLVCDFLADVEKQGHARVSVNDEGDYYNTKSLDVLLKNFGAGQAVIDLIGKALEKVGWKPG